MSGDWTLPGLARLKELAREANQRAALVGVPKGLSEQDGTPLAEVAATHEFGSPEQNIPERSFLRAGIRNGQSTILAVGAKALHDVIDGGITMDEAVRNLGSAGVVEIKREIQAGHFAPLNPETIRRKGNARPLIETHTLMDGISYEIEGHESAGRNPS